MAPDQSSMPMSYAAGLAAGAKAAITSVFVFVLFGTFIGYGALCHDLGFTLPWAELSTALVWAGPAQVIVVTTLGSGSHVFEAAIAVSLSGMRLFPMVVALLPVIKTPTTRIRDLLLPAHLTAVSMWVEGLRVAPSLPRERRVAFCNGLGLTMMGISLVATAIGFVLAQRLPALFGAAVLFLTPMSFLVSTARNSRALIDKIALVLGLVLSPIFALAKFDLALLLAGLAAGTIAYGVHRMRP